MSNTIDWRGASHYFQRYVLGCFFLFFLSWMSLLSGIAYVCKNDFNKISKFLFK
jgi:hypothetical protein